LQGTEPHAFDIAADAALAETQRHSRLESMDHAGRHLGVSAQIEIQPIRPGNHELLQPRWTCVYCLFSSSGLMNSFLRKS
jgi:hypothetical protein